MKRIILFLFCVLSVTLLTNCARVGMGAHRGDYLKKGKTITGLRVPVGVPPIQQQPYYSVPALPVSSSTGPMSTVPPTLK